jgi:hypothetical protein
VHDNSPVRWAGWAAADRLADRKFQLVEKCAMLAWGGKQTHIQEA